MDTRFSSAIHALILISEADSPINSTAIAASVGTNASYIRKLTAPLAKAGFIESSRAAGGFTLTKPAQEISLRDVYCAVTDTDQIQLFDIHENPNDECIVGAHIRPTLTDVFHKQNEAIERELAQTTLADCIAPLTHADSPRTEGPS